MKTSTLFKSILFTAFLASTTVFGQVKIGTNPTTIDPANNLEIEASTPDRKISADKTTGKLTIKDGTEGDGKVLTSDANGGASWQIPGVGNPEVLLAVNLTTDVYNPNTIMLNYDNKSYDKGNNFTLPSTFTAPSDGYYRISLTVESSNVISDNGRASFINIAGSQTKTHYIRGTGVTAGDHDYASGSITVFLTAGDTVTSHVEATRNAFTVIGARFEVIKVSN